MSDEAGLRVVGAKVQVVRDISRHSHYTQGKRVFLLSDDKFYEIDRFSGYRSEFVHLKQLDLAAQKIQRLREVL